MMRTLVVVPTYNERDSIEALIDRLFAACADCDLLVVDDSSPDGTAEVVRTAVGEGRPITILSRESKGGLGTAYVHGFRWALERDYEAIVAMDADLSHDPASIPALVRALDNADLTIGSRYVAGGGVSNWGFVRRALSKAGNAYARLWLRFSVRDSTSGFRAFRVETLRSLELSSIRAEGYAFQIETAWRVLLNGGRITEVPITFVERAHGRSKLSRRIVLEALVRVPVWGFRALRGRRGAAKR
jgi:dolichol-phosphate mannosyltransferase